MPPTPLSVPIGLSPKNMGRDLEDIVKSFQGGHNEMQANSGKKRSAQLARSHDTPSRSNSIRRIFQDASNDFPSIYNGGLERSARPAHMPRLHPFSSPARHLVEDRGGQQHVVGITPSGSLEQAHEKEQRFPSIFSDSQYDFNSRFPNPKRSYFVPVEDEPHPLPHSPTPAHRQQSGGSVRGPTFSSGTALATPGKEPVSSGFNSPNDNNANTAPPLYHKPTHTVYHINNAATFASPDKSDSGGLTPDTYANASVRDEASEHSFRTGSHHEKTTSIHTWLDQMQESDSDQLHRRCNSLPFGEITQARLNSAPAASPCRYAESTQDISAYRNHHHHNHHHQPTPTAGKENVPPSSYLGPATAPSPPDPQASSTTDFNNPPTSLVSSSFPHTFHARSTLYQIWSPNPNFSSNSNLNYPHLPPHPHSYALPATPQRTRPHPPHHQQNHNHRNRCRRQQNLSLSPSDADLNLNPNSDQHEVELPCLPTPSPVLGKNAGSYENNDWRTPARRPAGAGGGRPGTPARGLFSKFDKGMMMKRRRTGVCAGGGNRGSVSDWRAGKACSSSDGEGKIAMLPNGGGVQLQSVSSTAGTGYLGAVGSEVIDVGVGVGMERRPWKYDEEMMGCEKGVERARAGSVDTATAAAAAAVDVDAEVTSAFDIGGEGRLETILSEPGSDDEEGCEGPDQGLDGLQENGNAKVEKGSGDNSKGENEAMEVLELSPDVSCYRKRRGPRMRRRGSYWDGDILPGQRMGSQ